MSPKITAFVLTLTLVLVITTPRRATAITCSDMYRALYPCLAYFQGGGARTTPSAACCSGIRRELSLARTGADRRAACVCLKNAAAGVSGSNIARAAALPAKCGVSIPYKLSPSTDCAKVQ